MALSPLEISTFYQILDRGGSVLDFTRGTLDDYVGATIGVMPCEEYRLPMMKSLRACVKDLDDTQRVKLFSALLDYYEQRHKSEFTASPSGYRDSSYRAERAAQVHLCRKALEREKSGINPFTQSSERLKEQFSSEYMSQQIDALNTLRNENPTDAIGKAKDLVESCCKTILKDSGVTEQGSWGMSELVKATMKVLNIATESVSDDLPEAMTVKRILGSLSGLVGGIAEFRNHWGSGHGKAADFEPLFRRHANLAVGSSITLTEYLWNTYLWRKESAKTKSKVADSNNHMLS